ncbi:Pyridoxamine 5'-phosphate oxidase [Pseudobythopirellula maris]|uniref:Pyridoxamine 5'-phosphate oxidase n=1 Tax=Pseudobythopirellula maris TaxID=2527991 RepID=A0A5C5ZMQ9_9BACT|nr:pyridoxamine 5'-phosphate oxidase family protein [Pseudobythopirellula maris]TWT88267.1 Pyridoxamine 5'-phosphate oxidase [Pseudobythopirellula maris]
MHDTIDSAIKEFILRQKMFFVATAPLAAEGRVNLSPKGLDSLRVLGPRTVAYADLVGSGVETIAHLKENGRIVLMFCAFDGAPKIVRLHGRGESVEPGHADFEPLRREMPDLPGLRSIIRVECDRISDSCGFGVPLYEFIGDRSQLTAYAEKKGPEGLRQYQLDHNAESLDGLPGVELAKP